MGLTFAAPALAKVVLGPALATWADGEGGSRRAGAAWGSLGAAAAALLAAGSWVRHAGCCASTGMRPAAHHRGILWSP